MEKAVKVKIGNHLSMETMTVSENMMSCRTPQQIKAFINLVLTDKDIVFFCTPSDTFRQQKRGQVLNCTFHVQYYKKDGYMYSGSFTPKGNKMKDIVKTPHLSEKTYESWGMTLPSEQDHIDEVALCIPLNKTLSVTNF